MTRYDPRDYCRPEILPIQPYQPGKSASNIGVRSEDIPPYEFNDVIKLASNENVSGPSPAAVEAVRRYASEIAWYPDSQSAYLKNALAERHNVSAQGITLGNGSNELLEIIGRCFLQADTEAVFSQHAFAVYALVTQACGARARVADANAESDAMPYGHNLSALLAQISDDTRVVFIANPNNPTGTWLEKPAIKAFLDAMPAHVIAVIDQAYIEYSKGRLDLADWVNEYPNLIVTQTFSKIFALAGLRIGYALSSPQIAGLLERVRQPFNVNSLAICAASAALRDERHVEQCVQMNEKGLAELQAGFAELGLETLPSAGNFLCVKVGDAASVYQKLLDKGIIVRPVDNYGLPKHLRITVGLPEHHQRLFAALREII